MRSSLNAGPKEQPAPLVTNGAFRERRPTSNFRLASQRAKRRAFGSSTTATSARGHHHVDDRSSGLSGRHHREQMMEVGGDLKASDNHYHYSKQSYDDDQRKYPIFALARPKGQQVETREVEAEKVFPSLQRHERKGSAPLRRARLSRQMSQASDEPLSGNLSPDLQQLQPDQQQQQPTLTDQMDIATTTTTSFYLDQLDLDEFVCSPRAIKLNGSGLLLGPTASQSFSSLSSTTSTNLNPSDQRTRQQQSHKGGVSQQAEQQQRLNLSLIYEYLEPSLVDIISSSPASNATRHETKTSNPTEGSETNSAKRTQLPEMGERSSSWLIGGGSGQQTHKNSDFAQRPDHDQTTSLRREFVKTNEGE